MGDSYSDGLLRSVGIAGQKNPCEKNMALQTQITKKIENQVQDFCLPTYGHNPLSLVAQPTNCLCCCWFALISIAERNCYCPWPGLYTGTIINPKSCPLNFFLFLEPPHSKIVA
jgi:hypothetical protein